MEIRVMGLDIVGGPENEAAFKAFIAGILEGLITNMEMPLESIGDVIFATEECYGQAIRIHKPSARFTKTETGMGIGRTVAHQGDDGRQVYSVVIRAEIITKIVDCAHTPRVGKDGDCQYNYFVICHELGHCKDYQVRPRVEGVNPPEDRFSVRAVNKRLLSGLINEVGANIHAGCIVNSTLFKDHNLSWNSTIPTMFEVLDRKRGEFKDDPARLYDLADTLFTSFWQILTAYTDLVVFRHVNPDLAGETIQWFVGIRDEELAALKELELRLPALIDSYPNWKDDEFDFVDGLFRKMVAANGFFFEEDPGGDAVKWLPFIPCGQR